MFFATQLPSFSHHLSPASHHKSTIKKPPSVTPFLQKPLQKHRSTTPEKFGKKNNGRAEALPSFRSNTN
jgi:hypothetical protein